MSHLLTSITFNIDMSDQEYWRKNLFVKVSVFLRSLVSKFLHNFYIIFCLTFQSDKCFWHNTNFPDDLLGELLSCRTKKLFLIILVILGLISYFRWLVFLWLIFSMYFDYSRLFLKRSFLLFNVYTENPYSISSQNYPFHTTTATSTFPLKKQYWLFSILINLAEHQNNQHTTAMHEAI